MVLALLLCKGLAAQPADDLPVELLPPQVRQGGNILARISEGPSDTTLQLVLNVDGVRQQIAVVGLDSQGRATVQAPLPATTPVGQWLVELSPLAGTGEFFFDTDPIEVLPGPGITLTPSSGYLRQWVDFSASNLVSGTVEVRVEEFLVFGPVAVTGSTLQGRFRMPQAGGSPISVVLENRVGNRLAGVGIADFSVLSRSVLRPTVSAVAMPDAIARDQTFELTGSLAVPEGSSVLDYQWTVVWKTNHVKPNLYPVDVAPIEFDPQNATNQTGQPVLFAVQVTPPSLSRGFPLADISQLDDLGFVYINPDTGESGDTLIASAIGTQFEDYEGITINGRLQDDQGSPLAGAIWTVEAQTQLIEPDIPAGDTGAKAAGSAPLNSAAALAHGNNQVAQAQAAAQVLLTPTGCPITLENGITDDNGDYFFAFSPRATEFLNAINKEVVATAGGTIEVFPPGDPARNEFLIRLSGLPLGHGIPVDNGNSEVPLFGGIYYEFRRGNDGVYRFRENRMGAFNQAFNPGDVLLSSMPPIPEGTVLELPTVPYILGLGAPKPRVTTDGRVVQRFSRLFSFPSRAGTSLDQAAVKLRLPWATAQNGALDASVIINGQTVGALAAINDNLCAVEGTDYELDLLGLATLDFAGDDTVVSGEINASVGDSVTYVSYFEILVERAPQWWRDTDSFSRVDITWSPGEVVIKATERDKNNDASADNVPKNVGNLDNNNSETAFTQQSIVSGLINEPFRVSVANATVANQSGAPVEKRISAGQTGLVSWFQELEPDFTKDTVEQLRARGAVCIDEDGDNDDNCEDLLLGDQITIIDTGKVPLFRYGWGVPPIVSATLGADIWFKALFTYYVFLSFEDFILDIDALAEPEVSGGIDVFFDLSALFGLVSANVTAAPALGVAMPIVINDNQFDLDESGPCFQFVLDLLAQFSIGICPLCVEHGVEERILQYAKPDACTVGSINKLLAFTKAASGVQSGAIGVAADGYGGATAIFAGTGGIQAVALDGGTPGQLHTLDTGRGAMRPDAAYFDAGLAVAVWAQSGLTDAEFDALPDAVYDDPTHCAEGDDNCGMTTPVRLPGTENQHLVYAVYETGTWGPTMDLTLPTTGEGGVKLAGCRGGDPGCPASGEILAVWERDTAADIRQHAIKLDYAFFNGATRSWSTVQTLHPASGAKDVQPEPVYLDGEPMVVWVRNPSATPANLNMQSRELWYEFVRLGAGPRKATGLPAAVASPSADVQPDGTVAVAFTKSTDASFIGNRRSLWIARGENCSAGICTWAGFEPRDQYGRRVFVEQPQLSVNPMGGVTVVGRQVGVDGAFVGDESIGIVTGAGDLFRLELTAADFTQGITQSLSNDGAINWNTAAAFEPTSGSLMMFNAKGAAVDTQPGFQFSKARRAGFKSGMVSKPVPGVATKGVAPGTSVFMNLLPWDPDLVLVSAVPETFAPSRSFDVDLEIQNRGAPTASPVLVEGWWNGPPGIGQFAFQEEVTLDALRNLLTLRVRLSTRTNPDEPRDLHLIVNPNGDIPESDASNNTLVLELGRMPVVTGLMPSVDRAGTMAFLDWTMPEDNRVAGYRVYRRVLGTQPVHAVGYTQTNGFVDLNVVPGVTYEYRVASMSAGLFESAPSEWVTASIGASKKLMVFKDGFEASP